MFAASTFIGKLLKFSAVLALAYATSASATLVRTESDVLLFFDNTVLASSYLPSTGLTDALNASFGAGLASAEDIAAAGLLSRLTDDFMEGGTLGELRQLGSPELAVINSILLEHGMAAREMSGIMMSMPNGGIVFYGVVSLVSPSQLVAAQVVPEPTSIALVLVSLLLLASFRFRRVS